MKLNTIASSVILLCTALCFTTNAQTSKKLYVATLGNDQGNGTIAKPFKTVEKAIAVAKGLKNQNVTVQLRGGTHYLANTLILNSKELLVSSLKIENYPKEEVVISAGRKLTLKWEKFREGIYQAKVPSGIVFERLYINGQPQRMARYPNYDPKVRFFQGTASDAIAQERVNTWKNPVGGYVHALHQHEWGSWDYLITSKDETGKLALSGGWQNNRPSIMHPKYRFVENIFEELDDLGEWYLDKEKAVLYAYPLAGVDLAKAVVEVAHLKNSIELMGSVEKPVRNVEIKGISFAHNERTFMDTKEPLLRSDWSVYRGGAILFDGTANCKITDCRFTGLGGNAMMLSNYNLKDTISGCYVANIGASAVCFIGSVDAVRSPLFNYNEALSYEQLDLVPGPKSNNYPQECVVTDNLFHHVGEIEKQATGVEISMSAEITVSHNSIYNTPRAGINIGDGTWGGHIIAYNDVFNTVQETGDHGAFNSWGRDRYWHPNRKYMDGTAKAHPELILLDAQKTTVIHDNRFRCDHGWDIDLDDGSSNYHIYNNLCLNGGLKLREGFYRTVENNIMVNNTFHPHVWFENSGDVFKHNIVTKPYAPIQITY